MTDFGPCAVCLVTDSNYLLPTIVAALQARRAVSLPDAAVIVLAMGLTPDQATRYADVCVAAGVQLVLVDRDVIGGSENASFIDNFFVGSKFTFGALGRFFLDQMVDTRYTQLLYIDGDVQLHGSLDPLLLCTPPECGFLAAPDPKTFTIHDDDPASARARRYMSGLGLHKDEFSRYFNSGVLRIDRKGWRDIGLEAWAFLRDNSQSCVCHDQSALNAVARGVRAPMSVKWNFAPFYRYYGLEPQLRPQVIHFMSHPKPWNGVFQPWTREEHAPYRDFVAAHPELHADLRLFGLGDRLKYELLQNYKRLDELLHVSRRRLTVERILSYERSVMV